MIDELAKSHLHEKLRRIRGLVVSKLDGLAEYDIRRPLTATGTNLLGLVKHLTEGEIRYFSEVFGRPEPWPMPAWDDGGWSDDSMWAAADETRADIVDRFHRACAHADATITALPLDAPGHVPWWPKPDITLFDAIVHILTETHHHAGHADILRETVDGAVGKENQPLAGHDSAYWQTRRAEIEAAASPWK